VATQARNTISGVSGVKGYKIIVAHTAAEYADSSFMDCASSST